MGGGGSGKEKERGKEGENMDMVGGSSFPLPLPDPYSRPYVYRSYQNMPMYNVRLGEYFFFLCHTAKIQLRSFKTKDKADLF